MEVDDLAAGDEGVDLPLVEQDDPDIVRLEAGRFDQRARDIAQERLGFRIAKNLLRGRRLRQRREAQRQQHQQPGEERAVSLAFAATF